LACVLVRPRTIYKCQWGYTRGCEARLKVFVKKQRTYAKYIKRDMLLLVLGQNYNHNVERNSMKSLQLHEILTTHEEDLC
jgi:hypothetical protein